MKHVLLIAILSGCWTAHAQVQPTGKKIRLDGTMGLSERNYTIRDSMVVDSLKRLLIGRNKSARLAATNTALTNANSLSTTCFSGNYVDLTNKPALFSGNYTDLTNKPGLFSGNYADLVNKPVLFSGSYVDLCCKPTIPTVPTSVSAFTNDADYQTGLQVRAAIRSVTDTLNTRLVANTTALTSVSAIATQALALAQNNPAPANNTPTSTFTLQFRATNVNTTAGANQAITHNFGANTGIDRIVAYEVNTRVSVDMPFDTSSVTNENVTIQPIVTTTYTAIIIMGHKLQ